MSLKRPAIMTDVALLVVLLANCTESEDRSDWRTDMRELLDAPLHSSDDSQFKHLVPSSELWRRYGYCIDDVRLLSGNDEGKLVDRWVQLHAAATAGSRNPVLDRWVSVESPEPTQEEPIDLDLGIVLGRLKGVAIERVEERLLRNDAESRRPTVESNSLSVTLGRRPRTTARGALEMAKQHPQIGPALQALAAAADESEQRSAKEELRQALAEAIAAAPAIDLEDRFIANGEGSLGPYSFENEQFTFPIWELRETQWRNTPGRLRASAGDSIRGTLAFAPDLQLMDTSPAKASVESLIERGKVDRLGESYLQLMHLEFRHFGGVRWPARAGERAIEGPSAAVLRMPRQEAEQLLDALGGERSIDIRLVVSVLDYGIEGATFEPVVRVWRAWAVHPQTGERLPLSLK